MCLYKHVYLFIAVFNRKCYWIIYSYANVFDRRIARLARARCEPQSTGTYVGTYFWLGTPTYQIFISKGAQAHADHKLHTAVHKLSATIHKMFMNRPQHCQSVCFCTNNHKQPNNRIGPNKHLRLHPFFLLCHHNLADPPPPSHQASTGVDIITWHCNVMVGFTKSGDACFHCRHWSASLATQCSHCGGLDNELPGSISTI